MPVLRKKILDLPSSESQQDLKSKASYLDMQMLGGASLFNLKSFLGLNKMGEHGAQNHNAVTKH